MSVQQEETIQWLVHSHIDKWNDQADYDAGLPPDDTYDNDGNLLLNAGITRIWSRLLANTDQALNSTNCRIGVGNSNTAAVATHTDLQAAAGAGNRQFELADSVNSAAQTLTVIATFEAADANFAWEEFGIDFGTADGTTVIAPLLNRKVQVMGSKANPAVWVFTVTVVLA